MLNQNDLHTYQQATITRLYESDRTLAILGMGLGKTVCALTAAKELLEDQVIENVLILAPLYVATTVWPTEINEWSHLKHLKPAVACGTAKERQAALDLHADITITNYENLQWLANTGAGPWDLIIFDESSKLKNPSGKRYKAFRPIIEQAKIRWGLTGTPAANHLLALYNQVKILDDGNLWGLFYDKWKKRFFFSEDPDQRVWKPWPWTPARLYQDMQHLAFKVDEADLPTLPEPVIIEHWVVLDDHSRTIYDELAGESVLEIDDVEIIAGQESVKINKLLQIAQGFIYDEDAEPHPIHDAKYDALDTILDELQGNPLLTFYQFQEDLTRLRNRYPKAVFMADCQNGRQAQQIIDFFNRGEIEHLLGHPASIGHGLNVQKAAHNVCMFGVGWDNELYMQAIKRVWRQGQKRRVNLHHIFARDTADVITLAMLRYKQAQEQTLVAAIPTV